MNYKIVTTKDFDKAVKHLSKKYFSLPMDLKKLEAELLENPEMGSDLGDNTRKVRVAIASKNKGKRGGARVITCNVLVNAENKRIYLLTIYDKGEQDSISNGDIALLKERNGLK